MRLPIAPRDAPIFGGGWMLRAGWLLRRLSRWCFVLTWCWGRLLCAFVMLCAADLGGWCCSIWLPSA